MPDNVSTTRLVVIGVISLLVFAVGIYWAVIIQRDQAGTLRSTTAGPAKHAGDQEIGIVYQPMFSLTPLSADEIAREKREIQTYGWADPDHKHVRVPIEKAIELQAKGGAW
jgi:hypothetical protein